MVTPKDAKKVVKTKKEPASKPGISAKRVVFRSLATVLFLVLFILINFSTAVYAHYAQSQDRAPFGQKVLGFNVGGKTAAEIQDVLEGRVEAVRFTFKVGEENYSVKPEEAGVKFHTKKTAEEVISSKNQGPFYKPFLKSAYSVLNFAFPENRIIPSQDARVSFEVDKKKLGDFSQSLSEKYSVDSKNAGLVMKGTEIEVVPAVYGRKIMTDSIQSQLEQSLENIGSLTISLETEKVDPGIIETETREAIAAAKALFSLPVNYTYEGKTYTPSRETVASWIVFETRGEKLVPVFDAKKIYPYIYSLSQKINVPAVNKKVTVKNGQETIVDQEGKNGLALDVDLASVNTAKKLSAGSGVAMVLPTYVVKYKTRVNNIVVANWEKYITVDISEQKMCAYLAGGIQVQCWAITTGAYNKGYATPIGTFLIQRKAGAGGAAGASGGGVCMPNPPSSTPLCGINYVSTFTPQGHAIHEAWWRSPGASNYFGNANYGWNGSHGCVNATYPSAKFIYNWAPIGTPVIIS